MSTPSCSSKIYTNPRTAIYTSTLSPSLLSNTILDFHTSLPIYTGPSPLIPLPKLSSSTHIKTLYLKDESQRLTLPSFQPLGLSWAIHNGILAELSESLPSPLSPETSLQDLATRAKEAQIKVIAASDGSLGPSVARLSKVFGVEGINTRIFIPGDAREEVGEEVRREGAEAIIVDGDIEDAVREAWLHSVATDGVMVGMEDEENYEDIPRWIVEGYSTIFKELDTQLDGRIPDWVVVPVGSGGLAQAAVTHYKAPRLAESKKTTRILTVEPSAAAALYTSLQRGEITTVDVRETIFKEMGNGYVAQAAWDILKDGLDGSVVVEDEDVTRAKASLRGDGVEAGLCTAAVLAGFQNFLTDEERRKELALDEDSIVILIGTESLVET
ncbi:hypothetical protein WAI453_001782 [Rhynchosporium graminicola]|uniref:Tryptophan synthase beta chain-like PALP domain-containing protein n=1 Tax=Rhynchosporium graminicola TaxID=2792576 RepID=A0A1E1LPN0_9HELO|nr:uncharacterized protein RCO7_09102 [Rhynchosporium commune]